MRKTRRHISLADRRQFNRKVIWPQRRLNRTILKYDKTIYVRVKELKTTKEFHLDEKRLEAIRKFRIERICSFPKRF